MTESKIMALQAEEEFQSLAEKLKGRVAQIISSRELVINIGSIQGVEPKMIFAVLAESPLDIKDPISGESLGVIDREKVRVEATDVQENLTICRTYRAKATSGRVSATSILMSGLWGAEVGEGVETLRAKDSSLPAPLSPEESYVKIKDRVVLVEAPDY